MANKKWIGKANRQMKKKGTVGAFTDYCGGRVTQKCIDKAKSSDDPTLVRRAVFAENMRGLGTKKKAQSGIGLIGNEDPISGLLEQDQQVYDEQLRAQSPSVPDFLSNLEGMSSTPEMGIGQQLKEGIGGKLGDLKSGIASGNVSLSAAGDILGAGAQALFNKSSSTADDALRDDKKERTGAVVGGALSGAGKGFDIGNKIIPGLGGAIGAGIGAIGGAFGGNRKREKARKEAVQGLREQQAQDAPGQLAADAAFMARAGGIKLPGGQMMPLPDGGKLYKGRKHESGGIDLKRDNIEVEGGETERPIIARNGKTIDYIFSEHHKVNKKMQAKYGVGAKSSYADIHKKMEEGGIPKNYQELAKDQEDDMKRKGKNQYGPRGSKYIKRSGGLKAGIAKIKAQDGVPAWKQKLLDKGFVENPKTGAMVNPQKAMEMGLTAGNSGKEKTQAQIAEQMSAEFAQQDDMASHFDQGKVPRNEKEAQYLKRRMDKGAATEGERKAFLAYQNVGERTMDKINKQAETARVIASDPELATDAAQLGLGALASSEIPVVSQVAGGLNTLGYGARSLYYGAKGKGGKSALYGTLAGGSALGMVPGAAAADVATGVKAVDKLNKGIAARTLNAADKVSKTKAGKYLLKGADKVDDADAAIDLASRTAGATKLTHGAHNVEHGLHLGSTIDKEIGLVTGGKYKPSSYVMGTKSKSGEKVNKKSRYGGAKMKAQSSLLPLFTSTPASEELANAPEGTGYDAESDSMTGPITTEEGQENTPPPAGSTTASATAQAAATPEPVFGSAEEGNAFRQWLNDSNPEAARRLDLDASGSHTNAYIRRAEREFGEEYAEFMKSQNATKADPADEAKAKEDQDLPMEEIEEDEETIDDDLDLDTQVKEDVRELSQKELRKQIRDTKKIYEKTPPEAIAAGVAQLAAPLYALNTKPNRVGGYRAQTMKAPKLGRVSGEADKDRIDQNQAAMMASMEGMNIGPGALANYANLMAQSEQAKQQIDSQTQRSNMNLAAQEAQMQSQASQFNIGQQQRAQEYMRQLALAQNQEEFANKLGALDTFGSRIAGIAGDKMSYDSNYAQAKAAAVGTQDEDGLDVLDRSRKRQIDLRTKNREDIAAIQEQRKENRKNKKALKAERRSRKDQKDPTSLKAGGYIKRRGKVKRRK